MVIERRVAEHYALGLRSQVNDPEFNARMHSVIAHFRLLQGDLDGAACCRQVSLSGSRGCDLAVMVPGRLLRPMRVQFGLRAR